MRVDRGRAGIVGDAGEVAADPPEEPLAVGDWVLVSRQHDRAVVEAVAERHGTLVRADPGRPARPQLLAANVDLALVLAPLDRQVRPGWIERALVLAHEAGTPPIVVGTKADLAADPAAARERLGACSSGAEVHLTSVVEGTGVVDLQAAVAAGGTVVLLGPSGAGKSSLTNALAGARIAKTRDVRAADRRGRHTTTARTLHVLPGGGAVIDTPGVREIGLWETEEGLDQAFADIAELAAECRFADCSHRQEPGCAVRDALDEGRLDPGRLERWRGLQEERAAVGERARLAEQAAQGRGSAKDRRGRRARERGQWRRGRDRDEG